MQGLKDDNVKCKVQFDNSTVQLFSGQLLLEMKYIPVSAGGSFYGSQSFS